MFSEFKQRQETDIKNSYSRTRNQEKQTPMFVYETYAFKPADFEWHTVSKKRRANRAKSH